MPARFRVGSCLLVPLYVRYVGDNAFFADRKAGDALIEIGWADEPDTYVFLVETNTRFTPPVVRGAAASVRAAVRWGENP